MPLALLLSPDDQAVSAITGVLEEMSVTCERPLDGASAAKKLNSQSFDLVLVDCENLPAAKLIFDVCRNPKAGTSPIPIAIVDGRAGLPTAFRLGAELILTKPVAKDQARTTIRTAVSRLKKDEPVRSAHPVESTQVAVEPVSEVRAQAAAAGAASPAMPSKPVEPAAPALSAPMSVAKMQPQIEEDAIAAPPKRVSPPSRDLAPPQSFTPPPKAAKPEAAPVKVFEDPGANPDPIVADLDQDLPTPPFSSYQAPRKKKGMGSLYPLLFLMLAGGAFYAAWMYQPGFREIAEPWVDRILGSLKVPGQSAKPVAQPQPAAPASASQSASTDSANAAVPASTMPQSAASAAPAPAETSVAGQPPSIGTTDTGNDAAQSSEAGSDESKSAESAKTSTVDSLKESTQEGLKKKVLAAVPTDTELPGEKTAIILSSQGAEKRLLHRIQPAYPAAARRDRIEGTVVLKAVVSDAGKVSGVRLVEGNPTLATAAIGAVKQWRYRPYIRNGKAFPFQTIVLVEFQRH